MHAGGAYNYNSSKTGGEGGSLSLPKAHPHAMGISGLGASFILASLPFRVAILTPANTSLAPPLLNIW